MSISFDPALSLLAFVEKRESNRNAGFLKKISDYALYSFQKTPKKKIAMFTFLGILTGSSMGAFASQMKLGGLIGGSLVIVWQMLKMQKVVQTSLLQKERASFFTPLIYSYLKEHSLCCLQNSYLSAQIFFVQSSLALLLSLPKELNTENTPKFLQQRFSFKGNVSSLINVFNDLKHEINSLPEKDRFHVHFFDDLEEAQNPQARILQKKGCALVSAIQEQYPDFFPTGKELYEFKKQTPLAYQKNS